MLIERNTHKRVTNMSNTELNVFAANASKRYDLEKDKNADAKTLPFIAKLIVTVSADNVLKLLSSCNVSHDFATNKRIESAMIDAKALGRIDNILKFAVGRTDKMQECANECVRTVINFKNAKKNIHKQHLVDCLTSSFKTKDADLKALLFMKKNPIAATSRHAYMSERALSALGILSVNPNNSAEYVINDNAILQAIEARLTAKAA